MAAKYTAHFEGTCSKCKGHISIGDFIAWARVKGPKRIYHVNCANPQVWPYPDETTPTPTPDSPIRQPDSRYDSLDQLCALCNRRAGNHSGTSLNCPLPTGGYDPSHVFTRPVRTPPGIRFDEIPSPDSNPDILFDMQVPEETTPAIKPSSNGSDGLLDLISERVEGKVLDTVRRKVDSAVAMIDRSVKDKLDQLTIPSITIKRPDLPEVKLNNVHKQFKDILQLVNSGEYVYCHGAPGGHKSTIGPQLAEALGVRYGYMSLCEQTPEYVVRGYMSPVTNSYVEPPFVNFLRNGGLWAWEEADNSNDNLRNSLNTVLEQKQVMLDNGDNFAIHKDFYMIANGNTCGRGAHPAFPSRTSFDAAFASRFVFLEFEYDWALCKHIALGLNEHAGPIVKWAEQVSNWALANGVQLVMSPREVYKLAKLTRTTDLDDSVLLNGILRGLDVPSKEKMLTNYPFPHISRN